MLPEGPKDVVVACRQSPTAKQAVVQRINSASKVCHDRAHFALLLVRTHLLILQALERDFLQWNRDVDMGRIGGQVADFKDIFTISTHFPTQAVSAPQKKEEYTVIRINENLSGGTHSPATSLILPISHFAPSLTSSPLAPLYVKPGQFKLPLPLVFQSVAPTVAIAPVPAPTKARLSPATPVPVLPRVSHRGEEGEEEESGEKEDQTDEDEKEDEGKKEDEREEAHDEVHEEIVGGCGGTRYGCCPGTSGTDEPIYKQDEEGSNCASKHGEHGGDEHGHVIRDEHGRRLDWDTRFIAPP